MKSGFHLLALSLYFCALPLANPQDPVEDPDAWLVEGAGLISEGRLAEALSLYQKQKQTNPSDFRPYFYSGMASSQREDWSAAAGELKEALRLNPDSLEARVLYANTLTRLGQNELAVNSLEVFQDRKKIETLTNAWVWLLSDTYFRAGSNDNALRILAVLEERTPDDPRIELNRGQIYFVKGDHLLAREHTGKSIQKQPENNPVAYFELGNVLLQLGDTEGARNAYLEALRQDENNPQYLWKVGAACLALGESQEAIRYLELAKPAADTFPEIYYVLGRAYQAEKDRAKAAENLRKFQEVSNRDRKAQYQRIEAGKLVGRGEAELDQKNAEEAIRLFQEAAKMDPNSWAAQGYLAELYLQTGRLYLADEHIRRMRQIDPDDPVGLYLAATFHYQRGELEEARELAEQVRELRPGNAELRNLLGNTYLGLGQIERAIEEYKAAVSLAPERKEFRLNLETAERRLAK